MKAEKLIICIIAALTLRCGQQKEEPLLEYSALTAIVALEELTRAKPCGESMSSLIFLMQGVQELGIGAHPWSNEACRTESEEYAASSFALGLAPEKGLGVVLELGGEKTIRTEYVYRPDGMVAEKTTAAMVTALPGQAADTPDLDSPDNYYRGTNCPGNPGLSPLEVRATAKTTYIRNDAGELVEERYQAACGEKAMTAPGAAYSIRYSEHSRGMPARIRVHVNLDLSVQASYKTSSFNDVLFGSPKIPGALKSLLNGAIGNLGCALVNSDSVRIKNNFTSEISKNPIREIGITYPSSALFGLVPTSVKMEETYYYIRSAAEYKKSVKRGCWDPNAGHFIAWIINTFVLDDYPNLSVSPHSHDGLQSAVLTVHKSVSDEPVGKRTVLATLDDRLNLASARENVECFVPASPHLAGDFIEVWKDRSPAGERCPGAGSFVTNGIPADLSDFGPLGFAGDSVPLSGGAPSLLKSLRDAGLVAATTNKAKSYDQTRSDADGREFAYELQFEQGLLIETVLREQSGREADARVRYQYDQAERLVRMETPAFRKDFRYRDGRLSEMTEQRLSDKKTKVVEFK